eukprot:jgi/Psemu1/16422/gm1.16422_g
MNGANSQFLGSSMRHAGGDDYAALNFTATNTGNSTMQNANNSNGSSISHGDTAIYSSNAGITKTKAESTGRQKGSPKGDSATTNESNEDWLLPESFRPSKFDVIVGWARQNYHHGTRKIRIVLASDRTSKPYSFLCLQQKGNRMLRNLVSDNVPRYMAARTKHDKGLIIVDILDIIRRESPTGIGLVRQNSSNGRWSYIGNDKAKDKIGHALRKASRDHHKVQKRPSKSDAELSNKNGGDLQHLDRRRRTSLSSGAMSSLRISSWPSSVVSTNSASQSGGGGIRGTIDYNANGENKQFYASIANSSSTKSLKSAIGVPPSGSRKASPSPPGSSSNSSYHPFHSANHSHTAYHSHHPYPPPPSHSDLQYHSRNYEYHHHHHHHLTPNIYPHHHLPHHPPHDAHSARPQAAFQAINLPSTGRTAITPMTAATTKSKTTAGTPITSAPISSCSSPSFVPPPLNHPKALATTAAAPTNSSMSVLDVPSDSGNDLQVPVREVTVPASPVTRPNSVNSNISSRSSGSHNREFSPEPPPSSSSTPPSKKPKQPYPSKEPPPPPSSSHHQHHYHHESSHHGFHYSPHHGGGGQHRQPHRNEAVPPSSFYGRGGQFPEQQQQHHHLHTHQAGAGENGHHPEYLHYQYNQHHHPSVGVHHPQHHHHQQQHHTSNGTENNMNASMGHKEQHQHHRHHPLPLEVASTFPSSSSSQFPQGPSRYNSTNNDASNSAGIQLQRHQQQPLVEEDHHVSHRIFDEVEEQHQRREKESLAQEAAAAAVPSAAGVQQPPLQQLQHPGSHTQLQQHQHYPYSDKSPNHHSNLGHADPSHHLHGYY